MIAPIRTGTLRQWDPTLPPEDQIRDLLRTATGVVLGEGRESMILARLGPLMRHLGMNGLDELVSTLRKPESAGLVEEVLDLLTTHETSFFRDPPVFSWLRTYAIPTLLRGIDRKTPLRVWSAACSTGQEAWSVAMSVLEDHPGQAIEVVGSDISPPTVRAAADGRFSTLAANRGLPAKALLRWFERDGAAHYLVRPELRRTCRFDVHNLISQTRIDGPYDLVLLRNVLIYFSEADRTRALQNVAHVMRPGGILVLGTAEGLMPIPGDQLRAERMDNIGFRVRI